MERKADVTLRASFRRSPVQMGFFAVGPLVLAVAQLLNSLVTGLPLYVSVPFALLMLAYAVLYTRYHLAHLRLRSLDPYVSLPGSGRPG